MNIIKETLLSIHFYHKISPKENRYIILLISLLIVLIFSPFFQETEMSRLYFSLLISMVLVVGVFSDVEFKRIDYIETCLALVSLILTWVDFFIVENKTIEICTELSYALFFLYFNVELISKIIISNQVSANLVFASVVGFFMIGFCGASFASLIQLFVPNAYSAPSFEGILKFENFIYYSFVTITTVGYGDMLPIHPAAKTLAIVLCISGHLYSTIVMAIIIGKFISNSGKKPNGKTHKPSVLN